MLKIEMEVIEIIQGPGPRCQQWSMEKQELTKTKERQGQTAGGGGGAGERLREADWMMWL